MPAHVRLGWMQAFAAAPTVKKVTAPPGRLGVMCIASELDEHRVGFTVVEIKPDSPLAGTVVVGDRILSVDGEELCHYESAAEVMAHLSARASEVPLRRLEERTDLRALLRGALLDYRIIKTCFIEYPIF